MLKLLRHAHSPPHSLMTHAWCVRDTYSDRQARQGRQSEEERKRTQKSGKKRSVHEHTHTERNQSNLWGRQTNRQAGNKIDGQVDKEDERIHSEFVPQQRCLTAFGVLGKMIERQGRSSQGDFGWGLRNSFSSSYLSSSSSSFLREREREENTMYAHWPIAKNSCPLDFALSCASLLARLASVCGRVYQLDVRQGRLTAFLLLLLLLETLIGESHSL